MAANILHAQPHPISQVIAAWPSLALMCTVKIMSRVPSTGRTLAVTRIMVTAVIAIIAAYVSYFHMVGVAIRYGETGIAAYLLPLSVDGLVVVASIGLVDINTYLAQTAVPATDITATTTPQTATRRQRSAPNVERTMLRTAARPTPHATSGSDPLAPGIVRSARTSRERHRLTPLR